MEGEGEGKCRAWNGIALPGAESVMRLLAIYSCSASEKEIKYLLSLTAADLSLVEFFFFHFPVCDHIQLVPRAYAVLHMQFLALYTTQCTVLSQE